MSKAPLFQAQLINFIREHSSFPRRIIMEKLNAGLVRVNNHIVTDSGAIITESDCIHIDSILIEKTPRYYYKFNKPRGVISTFKDPSKRSDLSDYIKKSRLPQTLRPCGRLDRDSSGLLLFSNDGSFIHHVLHPSYHIEKTYTIMLNQPLKQHHQDQLNAGIFLPDGPLRIGFNAVDGASLSVTITVGRNRILRRAFDSFGYTVLVLHREKIGEITLGRLPTGSFEQLSNSEIKALVLS